MDEQQHIKQRLTEKIVQLHLARAEHGLALEAWAKDIENGILFGNTYQRFIVADEWLHQLRIDIEKLIT